MDFKAIELEILKALNEKNPTPANNPLFERDITIAKMMVPVIVKAIQLYHEQLNIEACD